MKKKFMIFAASLMLTIGLCSCGAVSDSLGLIYMGNTKPFAVTSGKVGTKVGTVKNTNLFNLVVIGDASVNKAAKMAGITKISHVDVKTTSVLAIFCTRTYYVYGE